MQKKDKVQIVYFSHGGGPLPILGDPSHDAMNEFMKKLPGILNRPEAILVISAHWEENTATVQSGANPPMLYDYYGFPEKAYKIKYPAPGNPELAEKICDVLAMAGVGCMINEKRGFDHGLFIPLKMMYPEADIPSMQISILHSLDAKAHIELGRALQPLLNENILIIGSGFSFHNLRAFSFSDMNKNAMDERNDAFQDWLKDTIAGEHTQAEREQMLIDWESAPYARYCHPREDHLLPLHVCTALAGDSGKVIFDDYIAGKRALAFLWG